VSDFAALLSDAQDRVETAQLLLSEIERGLDVVEKVETVAKRSRPVLRWASLVIVGCLIGLGIALLMGRRQPASDIEDTEESPEGAPNSGESSRPSPVRTASTRRSRIAAHTRRCGTVLSNPQKRSDHSVPRTTNEFQSFLLVRPILEPERLAEAAAAQLHLYGDEQVVGLVLLQSQVGVAGDPEGVVLADGHAPPTADPGRGR
jgi:hypothetical protein